MFHEQLIWYLQCSSILWRMNVTLYLFVSECSLLFLTHFIVNSFPYSTLCKRASNECWMTTGQVTSMVEALTREYFAIVGRNIFTEIPSANTHHLLRNWSPCNPFYVLRLRHILIPYMEFFRALPNLGTEIMQTCKQPSAYMCWYSLLWI